MHVMCIHVHVYIPVVNCTCVLVCLNLSVSISGQVIVCTDGLANVGLGGLDGEEYMYCTYCILYTDTLHVYCISGILY